MKWVTREKARVDRIACPWLIKRFIDQEPEFLFVPVNEVMQVAEREQAIPFDIPNVELGHHGDRCSFDAFIEKYHLDDPALRALALIVRGADTAQRELTSESPGLYAMATGFQATSKNDFENMARQFPAYDALYAFCRANEQSVDNGTVSSMDAMELLLTRSSALKLGDPAPSDQAVRAMLESAARAPDHDRLKPWRLILVQGDARQRLGAILAEALSKRNPLADENALTRERQKGLNAPLIIVVATRCDQSSKIPVIEQVLSAGCAAYSIMLAANAQGLGAMWRTGDAAYDNTVKAALGIEPDDYIVSFIYVGTNIGVSATRYQRPIEEFAQHWTGDHKPRGS